MSSADKIPLPAPWREERRLAELDGLRGWAALWVVIFHLGWETFGVAFPGFRNPVAAAFNGSLAVTVFFVLSGEALSSGFFAGRGLTQVTGLAVKRLPRLTIPVFFATLLTFVVARLGLAQHVKEAARLVNRPEWLGAMNPEALGWKGVLKFPLIDMYASGVPDFDRLPFLWTMNIEMLGSILVFVLLLCWSRVNYFESIVMALGLILLLNGKTANLSGFCFGVVISHWRHRGLFWSVANAGWWVSALASLGVVATFAASAVTVMIDKDQRIAPVLAPILVTFAFLSRPVMRFLAAGVSRYLGRISFPLYLVQYPVLVSFTTSATVWLSQRGLLDARGALLVAASSTVLCVVAAIAFQPVEVLTKKVGQVIGRALVRPADDIATSAARL